jgi:hypothetical protein
MTLYNQGVGGDHQTATAIIAASDSLHQEQADYVCSGSNDQVEINSAIDELSATGGSISLLDGTFLIEDPIPLKAKPIKLYGAGMDSTLLLLGANVDDSLIKYTESTNQTFITVEDLTLDGNKTENSAGSGIHIAPGGGCHVWDAVFKNIFIKECKDSGFITNDAHYYILDHVIIEYCDGTNAMSLAGGQGPYMRNCLIKLNAQRGLHSGADQLIVDGCHFIENGKEGSLIETETIRFVGNTFAHNSKGNTGVHSDLWIPSWAHKTTVVGNVFVGTDHLHAVKVDGNYNLIENNRFEGTTGIAVNDSGTGNQIRDNIGFVTENSGTATLLSAGTSIVVPHGLTVTPVAGDIVVTPMEAWGNMTTYYIGNYGATNFTIYSPIAPGQDVDFAWKAIVL